MTDPALDVKPSGLEAKISNSNTDNNNDDELCRYPKAKALTHTGLCLY